jgi:hypothetical protein
MLCGDATFWQLSSGCSTGSRRPSGEEGENLVELGDVAIDYVDDLELMSVQLHREVQRYPSGVRSP